MKAGIYLFTTLFIANQIRHAEGDPETAEMLETTYKNSGFQVSMLSVADAMAELSEKQHVPATRIATLYLFGGEYEKAIDWLEYGFERSDPNAPYTGVSIKNKNVRNHTRYQALLRKMGLDYWADNL